MNTEALIVTTPTGVDVELAIAGPGSRAYAFIIDWHIRFLIAITWFAAAAYLLTRNPQFAKNSPATAGLLTGLPAAAIYFLYHPLLETIMRGRTPGKRMAGVRIVNRQGGTPSVLAVLIRNAFRLLDCLPVLYAVGLATTIFSAQRTRFGDLAAGTLLVHDGDTEAKALTQLGSLALNPALDAGTVAVGNDLLLRWKELQPQTRRRLAHDLLSRIAAAVGSAPAPPGEDALDDRLLQQRLQQALSGRSR
ncbi:MAG TPA: RDD family protein [Steroidobacteraceae bacterium]|nr:RDD family protein [Steroidobacteraceae bacterium]